jgi:tetratricopeptide (TPR) repeat protein
MDTPDEKIAELRRAAVADPRNGEIRYLLGAELAQHRRYDEAVLELSAAVALNPLLHTARFQLGLLHLTMVQPHHAAAVLAPLENLEDHAPLKHFKRALEALAVDDFLAAVASLEHGMQLNTDNVPLNADMKLLLDRIKATMADNADAASRAAQDETSRNVHTDFSLYGLTRH